MTDKIKLDPKNPTHVGLALGLMVLAIAAAIVMFYAFLVGTYLCFKASVGLGIIALVTTVLAKKGIPNLGVIVGLVYMFFDTDLAVAIVGWLHSL